MSETTLDAGSLVVLFIFLSLLLGSLLRHAVLAFKIPFPYTVMLLVLGGCWGLLGTGLGVPGHSIDLVANISPHLLLQVFLPALIFESAFSTNAHIMSRGFGQALLLAGPGVLISTVITAVFIKFCFASYGWDWYVSLLFGALISATDPVAVVALLRDVGASKRLATLIEAESMLNDGTAFVLFIILNKAVTTGSISAVGAIGTFVRLSIGGPILGLLVGFLSMLWLNRVYNDAMIETSLTIFVAYLTFWIAEHPLVEVSSVLAVVFLALYLARNKTSISPDIEESLHNVWEMIAFIANTLIFVLAGAIVVRHMAKDHVGITDVVYLVLLYIMLHVVRSIMVLMLWPLLYRMGYGITLSNAVVLVFGGLRGAVGLALGLFASLEEGIDELARDRIMFQTSGVVLLTLLINATSIRYVLRWLGMTKPKPASLLVFNQAIRHLEKESDLLTRTLKQDNHFAGADWPRLHKQLPNFKQMIHVTETSAILSRESEHSGSEGGEESSIISVHNDQSEMPIETELRLRFLSAMKSAYWQQFEEGMTSKRAVKALVKATDIAMDNDSMEEIFSAIAPEFELQWSLKKLYELTSGNAFFNRLLCRQLSYAVELGTAFLEAAQRIDQVVLGFPELSDVAACAIIKQEMEFEVSRAQEAWLNVQRLYPAVYRGILTKHAAEFILHRERNTTRKLYRQGLLDDSEMEHLLSILNTRLRDLHSTIPVKLTSSPISAFLREVPFLSGLSIAEVKRVRRSVQPRIVAPGETLYTQGECSNSLIIIRSGLVNMLVDDDEVLDTISAGSVLGSWSLRSHAPFLVTARADTLVEALVLDKDFVLELCRQHPSVSHSLWKMAAVNLLKTFFRERFLALTQVQLGELANDAVLIEPKAGKYSVTTTSILVRGSANGERAPLLLLAGSKALDMSRNAVLLALPGTMVPARHLHSPNSEDPEKVWMRTPSARLLTKFYNGADTLLKTNQSGADIQSQAGDLIEANHNTGMMKSDRFQKMEKSMQRDADGSPLSVRNRSWDQEIPIDMTTKHHEAPSVGLNSISSIDALPVQPGS